jgi:hypothetical protein
MKKAELAKIPVRRLAPAEATEKQLDQTVSRIIRALRRGEPAHLPGVGTLNPGKPWTFRPERAGNRK